AWRRAMTIHRTVRAVALIASLSLVAISGAPAMQNGVPDGSAHPYVGVLFATFFGQTALVGGVTLIAPDVALARGPGGHLIDVNAAQGNAAGPITVNFAPNGDFTPANSIPVREYHVYPGYLFSGEPGGGNREGILDVTVLILDTASAPPAAFVPPPIPL